MIILRSAIKLVLLGCLSVALVSTARADVTGRISGTVREGSGSVVAGARVTALNVATGSSTATVTGAAGTYVLLSLVPGRYELTVESEGFKEYRQTGLVVELNASLRMDVELAIGQVLEQVTVTAADVHVETESTQLGEVIEGKKMTTIPLNGRSYTDLLALQPGVVPISSGQYNPLSPSGNLNAGSLSIGGQRETANGFMVNGGNVEEGTNNGTAIIPNLDSIEEFRIITNNFDPEYGNYSGGQINVITKSGTNKFHGSAFDFLRNTSLDARNYFSPKRGVFHQNEFGGTFGGPVVRKKLFVFADYQGTRQIVGEDTGSIPVPSSQDRIGNLGDVGASLSGSVVGQNWANHLSQVLGYPVTPGEPYYFTATQATPACTDSAQCVFPNATIPQAAFSAPAQALLKYIPNRNTGSGYSTSAFSRNLRDDKTGLRMDAETRWGRLSAYYFLDDYTLNDPYQGNVGVQVPGFSSATAGRAQQLNLSDTLPLSGGLAFNEFRFNYLRAATNLGQPQGGLGTRLSSLGFATGPNTLGIVPLSPKIEGVPSVTFNSFALGVPATVARQYNNTFQWLDNYSRVIGSHTLKFGANFHFDQITTLDTNFNNGQFQFNGTETGNDFADFLLGAPTAYLQGLQLPLHSRARYLGLYAQDNWHATPTLTVNYGLRWELSTPWSEKNNQLETIVPGLQSVVFPGAPRGWVVPGDPGVPSTVAPTRYKNFSPRFGFAYSPEGKTGIWRALLGSTGTTSIRAAYGIFYTAIEQQTNALVVGDAPFGFFYFGSGPQFATPFVNRGDGTNNGQRFSPLPVPPTNVSARNPDPNVNWAQFEPIGSSPGYLHTNGLPSTQQFQLSLDRQLSKNMLLKVSYVGALGRHLLVDREANPGNAALCLSLPGCGPFGEDGTYTSTSGQTVTGTRPLSPGIGSNGWYANIATSSYHALQTTFRYSTGPLELLGSYTYSKSLDLSSGLGEQVNPINPGLSRALSAFDMTHNFVVSFNVALPFNKAFGGNRLTKGWVLSGITRVTTGLPVTLSENDDNSLLGTFSTGPNSTTIDLPNLLPGSLNITNPRGGKPYFNTSLFLLSGCQTQSCPTRQRGVLGNSRRRFFHGPGLNDWDMALLKDLRLSEAMNLQFRFELFNVFNHAQFNNPSGNILDSTNFGRVTSARDPRIGQVAIKFNF